MIDSDRPYDQSVVEEILYGLMRGLNVHDAGARVGIDKRVIDRWSENPEFERTVNRVQAELKMVLIDRIQRDGNPRDLLALLERLDPKNYSAPQIQLTQTTINNVQINAQRFVNDRKGQIDDIIRRAKEAKAKQLPSVDPEA